MRFYQAIVGLAVAGLAASQLPDVPNCSVNCFVSSLTSDGCSNLTDFACHCQKPELVEKVTPCVQEACSKEEQSSVSQVVVSQCSAAGHPISVPPVDSAATATGPVDRVVTSTASSSAVGPSSTPVVGSSSRLPSPSSSHPLIPSSSKASPSSPVFTGAATKKGVNGFGGAAAVAAFAAVAV